MPDNDDNDFIFGRLQNELKQIEELKSRTELRKRESESNWLSDILREIGNIIGKIIALPFELLGNIIENLFSKKL